MVSKVFIVAFAAFCLCQVAARPEEQAVVADHLQTMFTENEKRFDTLRADLAKVFGYEETKEAKDFVDTIKSNSKIFGDKMIELAKEGEKKVKEHSSDAESAVQALKEKMAEVGKKIEELQPEASAKVKEYNTKLGELYKEITTKAKETFDIVDKDTSDFRTKGKKYIEEVMDSVKANMEKMTADVKKAIEEHGKKA